MRAVRVPIKPRFRRAIPKTEGSRARRRRIRTHSTSPLFRRGAPLRMPLAIGLLPFFHVVFGFEPGEEAPAGATRVVVFRVAMAGIRAVAPERFAGPMLR